MDLLDRLSNKFLVDDGCWEWTAAKDCYGYGRFSHNGRNRKAYRVIYELLVGPVPAESLDHLCRNRGCVRPDHLEPVSHRVNVLRGVGASARNARKTECKHGHPYSGANLILRPKGGRKCRICSQRWAKSYRAKETR